MRRLLDQDAPTHHELRPHAPAEAPDPTDHEIEPTMVPPSNGNDSQESVEALLKDFISMDVVDERASHDDTVDRAAESMDAVIDAAPGLDSEPPFDARLRESGPREGGAGRGRGERASSRPGERAFTLPPDDGASIDSPEHGDEAGFWRAVPSSPSAPSRPPSAAMRSPTAPIRPPSGATRPPNVGRSSNVGRAPTAPLRPPTAHASRPQVPSRPEVRPEVRRPEVPPTSPEVRRPEVPPTSPRVPPPSPLVPPPPPLVPPPPEVPPTSPRVPPLPPSPPQGPPPDPPEGDVDELLRDFLNFTPEED